MSDFRVWNQTGASCNNCGGQYCDICFTSVLGKSQASCGNPPVMYRQFPEFNAEILAHEYGHYNLCLPDEYSEPDGGVVLHCGHSVMSQHDGTNNNLCTTLGHGFDGTPGAPPQAGVSANWTQLNGVFDTTPSVDGTPDNYDYTGHSLGGFPYISSH